MVLLSVKQKRDYAKREKEKERISVLKSMDDNVLFEWVEHCQAKLDNSEHWNNDVFQRASLRLSVVATADRNCR